MVISMKNLVNIYTVKRKGLGLEEKKKNHYHKLDELLKEAFLNLTLPVNRHLPEGRCMGISRVGV